LSIGRVLALAIATAAVWASGCSAPGNKQAADTIYTGGDIVTVNDAQPTVEALAVKDGRILGVGRRDDIEKGLRPTNDTDFIVAPLNQLIVMWSAVNRISRSGVVIGPDQRITPLEALKAITINAAYQYSEQGSKGSLEPGKLADLVILDKNPLKVEPMAIKDIAVVETIKEAKSIYKAK
jgi:predicted amidohydrolase YtcJ